MRRRAQAALAAAVLLISASFSVGASDRGRNRDADAGQLSRAGTVNLQLAQSYLQSGELEQALDKARRVLRSDPRSPDAYAMLGLIHTRAGDQTEADAAFRKAAQLGPTNGPVLNAYAVWLCQQNRHAEADGLFLRAFVAPGYSGSEQVVQAYHNAGRCALMVDESAKAADYLRRGLEIRSEDPAMLQLMAEAQSKLGDHMKARAFIQRREAVGAIDAQVLDLAARIEEALGNAAGAVKYRSRLRAEFPNYPLSPGEGARQP